MFGGFKNQFGWFFLGFGMIFFIAFALNSDWSFIYFQGDIITIEGTASGFVEIDASEGEVPVFENHYYFISDDGVEYEGVSYATGQRVFSGDTVVIEYPEGKPEYSRIKGMRREIFSSLVVWTVIFPLVGLVFILLGLKRSIRALRLLKNGELTTGTLIEKVRTNTKINGQVVYKMTFRYHDDQGNEYEHKERTRTPYFLQDQKKEKLLYLKRKPSYAIMLDSLPSFATINVYGRIESSPILRLMFLLIIPAATIIGLAIYFMMKYLA